MSPYLTSQPLSFDAIAQLTELGHNRHALRQMEATEFSALRHQILAGLQSSDEQAWYLLGTDGCHLCHEAQSIIETAATVYAQMPTVCVLDLADAADERLVDLLGRHIPILMTDSQLLCYPFGLMDIIPLTSNG